MKQVGWLILGLLLIGGGLWWWYCRKQAKPGKQQEPPRKTPSGMSETQKLEALELLHDVYELYRRAK